MAAPPFAKQTRRRGFPFKRRRYRQFIPPSTPRYIPRSKRPTTKPPFYRRRTSTKPLITVVVPQIVIIPSSQHTRPRFPFKRKAFSSLAPTIVLIPSPFYLQQRSLRRRVQLSKRGFRSFVPQFVPPSPRFFYTPPLFSYDSQFINSLHYHVPTATVTYKLYGKWYNTGYLGVDRPQDIEYIFTSPGTFEVSAAIAAELIAFGIGVVTVV